MSFGDRVRRLMPRRFVVTKLTQNNSHFALTFDDGPHPEFTPKVLDVLDTTGAKATFFLIGRNAEKYPELTEQIVARGHELANHSWSHPRLGQLSYSDLATQIERTDAALSPLDGQDRHLFRPPWGTITANLLAWTWRQRSPVIHWSVDSFDYKMAGAEHIINRFADRPAVAGDIALFHDDNQFTIDALSELLPRWRDQGLDLVTVSAALGLRA